MKGTETMGFDDILQSELEERGRREHDRRQRLMALPGHADEARDNAQAAVVKALAAVGGLSQPGFASTGFPPPIKDDGVKRGFAVTARTESGQIEFMISGVLECRIEDERFTYDHQPLRIQATGFNFMQPRTREATFTGTSCGVDHPSCEIDVAAFKTALQDLVKKLAA
jgi:hypothetical protein